jgi:hypothetical protein
MTSKKKLEEALEKINKHMDEIEQRPKILTIQSQKEITEMIRNNIWNAAIEAAANECGQWDMGSSPKAIADEIRGLKK